MQSSQTRALDRLDLADKTNANDLLRVAHTTECGSMRFRGIAEQIYRAVRHDVFLDAAQRADLERLLDAATTDTDNDPHRFTMFKLQVATWLNSLAGQPL